MGETGDRHDDKLHWRSSSPEQTIQMGDTIGRSLVGGMAIGLVGALGSGKTQLVKGIAQGNAEAEKPAVTSPTFVLVNEYPGRLLFFHLDVYRLKDARELATIGFDEMFAPDTVVVVEWADRVKGHMPEDTLWVTLAATGETTRRIDLEPFGPLAAQCVCACRDRVG